MRVSRFLCLLIGLMSMLVLPACATASRGASDYLRVDSVPQGATVTTTMETSDSRRRSAKNILAKKEYIGCSPTPCAIKIFRRQRMAIKIEHPDFEPAEVAIGGAIQQQNLNVNMANMATGVGGGAFVGGLAGSATVLTIGISDVAATLMTFGYSSPTSTSGIVSGATASGATIGLAVGAGFVAVDMVSGANHSIYPNPVVVQLAPKGSPTVVDPNMLMFRVQQAKKKLKFDYCRANDAVSDKIRTRNCKIAQKMDAKNAIENAELLASEPEVVELIKSIKAELKKQRKAQRAAQRASTNNKSKDSKPKDSK